MTAILYYTDVEEGVRDRTEDSLKARGFFVIRGRPEEARGRLPEVYDIINQRHYSGPDEISRFLASIVKDRM